VVPVPCRPGVDVVRVVQGDPYAAVGNLPVLEVRGALGSLDPEEETTQEEHRTELVGSPGTRGRQGTLLDQSPDCALGDTEETGHMEEAVRREEADVGWGVRACPSLEVVWTVTGTAG